VLPLEPSRLPLEHPVDVANGLPIFDLVGAELVAGFAEVAGMAASEKRSFGLIRPQDQQK
jgi:hypothetical protein